MMKMTEISRWGHRTGPSSSVELRRKDELLFWDTMQRLARNSKLGEVRMLARKILGDVYKPGITVKAQAAAVAKHKKTRARRATK